MSNLKKDIVWKPVVGFEGCYEVSNTGHIKSLPRKGAKGGIRKTTFDMFGYERIVISRDDKILCRNVHRLVAMAFIPNPLNKPCINHIDGVKGNNVVENLEWCTYKENNIHAIANGFVKNPARGERIGRAKLKEQDVRDIKLFLSKGIKRTDIARVYPVGRTSIDAIANGLKWRHV